MAGGRNERGQLPLGGSKYNDTGLWLRQTKHIPGHLSWGVKNGFIFQIYIVQEILLDFV